jgi:K+-sensing histidine kinase KdpD
VKSPPGKRRVLFVAPKREAQPILSELRSNGHQVSLVEDLDEAGAILQINGFDAAVLEIENLELLMKQKFLREREGVDHWRREMAGVMHDLTSLISAFGQMMQDARRTGHDHNIDMLTDSVETIQTFAGEVMGELNSSRAADSSTVVDLEDVIEAAAIVVYPSATDRGQRLAVNIDPDVAEIKTLPAYLKRALKNVLEYVSQHAPDLSAVSLEAVRDGRECVICVSTRSGGGSGTDVARTLRRFTNGEQTLPLVVAHELTEQLGGRLWIESEKDRGVAVYLALPHRVRRGARAAGAARGG